MLPIASISRANIINRICLQNASKTYGLYCRCYGLELGEGEALGDCLGTEATGEQGHVQATVGEVEGLLEGQQVREVEL